MNSPLWSAYQRSLGAPRIRKALCRRPCSCAPFLHLTSPCQSNTVWVFEMAGRWVSGQRRATSVMIFGASQIVLPSAMAPSSIVVLKVWAPDAFRAGLGGFFAVSNRFQKVSFSLRSTGSASSGAQIAYLSPEVLEQIVIERVPLAVSLKDLVAVADRPWAEQMGMVFE